MSCSGLLVCSNAPVKNANSRQLHFYCPPGLYELLLLNKYAEGNNMAEMTENRPLILIIDDEKQTSHTMAMALAAVGYSTEESDSARDGLKVALETHPQLIVLDYNMGDKDGVEVLHELRKDSWGKTVPVIVASNVYDVDVINDIMSLGVQDYVLKADVNLNDIVKLVGQYVPLASVSGQ